jgi:predicted secreted protein
MTITAAIVLFAVTWFMTFFVVLPLRFTSQGDAGDVVPGTPASAPAGFIVKRKAKITTIAAFVIWAILSAIILSGVITVRDIDFLDRLPPRTEGGI